MGYQGGLAVTNQQLVPDWRAVEGKALIHAPSLAASLPATNSASVVEVAVQSFDQSADISLAIFGRISFRLAHVDLLFKQGAGLYIARQHRLRSKIHLLFIGVRPGGSETSSYVPFFWCEAISSSTAAFQRAPSGEEKTSDSVMLSLP